MKTMILAFVALVVIFADKSIAQRWIRQSPESLEQYNKAVAYYNAGQIDEAEETITNLMSTDSSVVEAMSLFAVILVNQGKYELAKEWAEKALSLNPADPTALSIDGLVRCERGDLKHGIPILEKSLVKNIKQPYVHCGLGQAYFSEGRFTEAIKSLKRAEALGYSGPILYKFLGSAYVSMKEYALAVDPLKAAIKGDPNDWLSHKNLAEALIGVKREDDAAQIYESARTKFPEMAMLHTGLALLRMNQGRWSEAEEALSGLSVDDKCTAYYGLVVAFVAMKAGDKEAADVGFIKGFRSLQNLEEYSECLFAFDMAEDRQNVDSVLLRSIDADSVFYPLLVVRNSDQADYRHIACKYWLHEYHGKLDNDWTRAERSVALSIAFTVDGPFALAENAWREACQLDSSSSNWLNYGSVLHIQKKLNEAESAYIRCLALSPNCKAALINLMIIYQNQQDKVRFKKYFDEFMRIDDRLARMIATNLQAEN